MDRWMVLWRHQDCGSAFQELLATQSPQNHTVSDLQRTSKIIWWHLRKKTVVSRYRKKLHFDNCVYFNHVGKGGGNAYHFRPLFH